jgi:hypothetical protein
LDFTWRIYPAFEANLTEAAEAGVGSGATFRFELADNLNFRHLAKIESISGNGGMQAARGDRGQRILNFAAGGSLRETEISPCPPNRGTARAQTPQSGPMRRRLSVHLSGHPLKFADK